MRNNKFTLLISEFSVLSSNIPIMLDATQALVCHYAGVDCYLEDGARIGIQEQLLIVIPLNKKISSKKQTAYNSDFSLTRDGYITEINNRGCCYIRHRLIPDHPQQLARYLSDTVNIVNHFMKEKLL
ncbi:conserved hypothetical protein [Vibrio aestuarianus]|nr:conserved hypothetical protein [Vibrio aestuarianus]